VTPEQRPGTAAEPSGRRPGPRPDRAPLEQGDVVAAALRVLNRSGLDGLTMRRVAEELNAQAPSLYHHVRDKEHLIDLLGDAMLAEIDLSTSQAPGWPAQLAQLVRAARRALLHHRDAGRVLGGRFPLGPNGLVLTERLLAILAAAGFPRRHAAFAVFTLSSYIIGFISQEVEPMSVEERENGDRATALAAVQRRLTDLDPARFPHVRAHATPLTEMGMDQRFEFGLTRLIDGLRQLHPTKVDARPRSPASRPRANR
jgi:TetR/AcrR family tetracycline transcriptional repressor